MKYFPMSITVRQLSEQLKKAGLIPPLFTPQSEKQFTKVATGLKFHPNEVKEQIAVEKVINEPRKQTL